MDGIKRRTVTTVNTSVTFALKTKKHSVALKINAALPQSVNRTNNRPTAKHNIPTKPTFSKRTALFKVKHLELLKYFDRKQVISIVATFAITFVFSIAVSQGLAAKNQNAIQHTDNNTNAANQAEATTLPVLSAPRAITLLSDSQTGTTNLVYLPQEKISLPDPLQQRKGFLQKYLTAKNSVLAQHVDALSEQTQWKLIVAISRAESSFCKRHAVNNCWGIGGAANLKAYQNYDQAIADVNRILETHYINAGLQSPSQIVNKWVGHPNDSWEAAVSEELNNLKDIK